MRLVYKKFADGKYKVYTTDENGKNERVLDSDVPPDHKVRRVPVFIEVNCDEDRKDDARQGLDQLLKSIDNAN